MNFSLLQRFHHPKCLITRLFALYKKYESGGAVLLMEGLDKNKDDFKDLLVIADRFASIGKCVKILAAVHFKDPIYDRVYSNLIGTRFYRKCPDLMVDGVFYEYESFIRPWNKKKVQRMLSNGLHQSPYVILDNNKGAADRHIRKLIKARLNLNAPIEEVWVFEKGEIRLLYKNNRKDESFLRGNAP